MKKIGKNKEEELLNAIKNGIKNNKDKKWLLNNVFKEDYFSPGQSEWAELLITGKVKGYDGAHIIGIKECEDMIKEVKSLNLENVDEIIEEIYRFAGDKNNIVFLKQTRRGVEGPVNGQHRLVHAMGEGNSANVWKNSSNLDLMNK